MMQSSTTPATRNASTRRRYERRDDRLRREEQHRQAERLARAQRPPAGAANVTQADSPSTAPGNLNDVALKKAKVTLAMARAQLNKSLKAFGHPPTAQQQSQLVILQQQFEAAQQVLAQLESVPQVFMPTPPANTAELKRAKIQLAMRRAELQKAISPGSWPRRPHRRQSPEPSCCSHTTHRWAWTDCHSGK